MRHKTRPLTAGIAAAVTLTLSASLAACGGSSADDGDVTLNLVWWGDDTRADMYAEAAKAFEAKHPDIDVKTAFGDYKSYWTSRSTEAAGRSLPDVMQVDQTNLVEYSRNGALLDLSPYVGKTIKTDGIDEIKVSAGEIDDKQFGVPVGTSTLSLIVNTSLAEQAGVGLPAEDYTWSDLTAWSAKATDAGVKNGEGKAVYGGYDRGITMWYFLLWLTQQGTEPFAEDGSFNFTKDDVQEFMDLDKEVRDAEGFFPPERATQIAPEDGFAKLETASSFTYDAFLARYEPTVGTDLTMLPPPAPESGERTMFSTVLHMAAGANTEHPEEAAELLAFFANDPEVAEIFGTSRGVPADQAQVDALNPEPGSTDQMMLDYAKAVEPYLTSPTPSLPVGFATLESEWVRLNEDLMYDRITTTEFASQWWDAAEIATE